MGGEGGSVIGFLVMTDTEAGRESTVSHSETAWLSGCQPPPYCGGYPGLSLPPKLCTSSFKGPSSGAQWWEILFLFLFLDHIQQSSLLALCSGITSVGTWGTLFVTGIGQTGPGKAGGCWRWILGYYLGRTQTGSSLGSHALAPYFRVIHYAVWSPERADRLGF